MVVPQRVDAYHPAWWGPVNTADDSATWKAMLYSTTYLLDRQEVRARQRSPACDRSTSIACTSTHQGTPGEYGPATPATPGDPISGTGYVVNLLNEATISGGHWSTDNIAGITLSTGPVRVAGWTGH